MKTRIRETKDDVIMEYRPKDEKNRSRTRLLVSYPKRDNLSCDNPVFMDVILEYQIIKIVKAAVNLREKILSSALLNKNDEYKPASVCRFFFN